MRTKISLALVLITALTVAAAASGSPRHAKVSLRSTSLGHVLVDARGHTLYLFMADHGKKSACYGQCAAFWPPLLSGAAPAAGTGVKASLLSTSKRKDGTLQVVYAGHPLYLFSLDKSAGQVKGEGFNHFGGKWYVVSASGTKILPATASSTSSGGGTTTTTGGGTSTDPYPYP